MVEQMYSLISSTKLLFLSFCTIQLGRSDSYEQHDTDRHKQAENQTFCNHN
jgi:hypothetical protein